MSIETSSDSSSAVSLRKLRANRRNARKSTGPRTDAGKARSSRNAVVHGLFCKSMVLPGENPHYFRDFQCDLLRTLNPRDAMELTFVQQIISACWRIKRVPAAEAEIFDMLRKELHAKFLDECKKREELLTHQLNGARYSERAALQAELDQFRQHVRDNPSPPRSAGQLLALMLSNRASPPGLALDRLHRHEQRLANTIARGMKQLRELRENASSDEASELTHAMLFEAGEENVRNEPSDPRIDDKFQGEKGLATDGARINTDKAEENGTPNRGAGFQPVLNPPERKEDLVFECPSTG